MSMFDKIKDMAEGALGNATGGEGGLLEEAKEVAAKAQSEGLVNALKEEAEHLKDKMMGGGSDEAAPATADDSTTESK